MDGEIADRTGEVVDLRHRFARLEDLVRRKRLAAETASLDLDALRDRPVLSGHATAEGCRRLRERSACGASFHRPAQGLAISSVGIGTGRGEPDEATDAAYARSLEAALQGGINLVDTAINYRLQRSECAVGSGLRAYVAGGGHRHEVVVCSKAGFVVPGAVSEGCIAPDEAGFHSLAPAFLVDQLDRSRRNIGLETIDVYYLHNPEVQLPFVGPAQLEARLIRAFAQLERAVSDGHIRHYGVATWSGFRDGALSLPALVDAACQVAGNGHHFRFVQVPCSRAMGDAGTVPEIAAEAGLTVIASAALGGAAPDEAVAALQFARSVRGITSALVGMRRLEHVRANLALARNA